MGAIAATMVRHFQLLVRNYAISNEAPFFEIDLEENRIGVEGALALLRSLQSLGKKADVELCLFGNPGIERGVLRNALSENGEDPAAADDPRLKIEISKAEHL